MPLLDTPNDNLGRDRSRGNIVIPRSGDLYTWEGIFREPVQNNIAEDSAVLYFPLNEADPSTVTNTLGTKTLSLVGSSGHIVNGGSSNMYFNSGDYAIFDGQAYLKGDVGLALGTQDLYVEFDYYCWSSAGGGVSPVQICGGGPAVLGNSSWAVSVYIDGTIYFYIKDSAGNYKSVFWTSTDGLYSHTWHRVKIEIDRDNTANRKCWVDGVLLTQTSDSLGDASAEDITGTHFEIGAAGYSASYIPYGGISCLKVVYGSYTGSTTSAFKTTPTVGSGLTYTRNSIKKTVNFKRNYYGGLAYYTQLQGNPSVHNYDYVEFDEGILIEPSVTNYVIRSRELDNVAWAVSGGTTVTPNSDTYGFDGVPLADRVTMATTGDYIQQDTSLAVANVYHCFSVFIRAVSGTLTSSDLVLDLIDIGTGTVRASGLYDADTGLEITAANGNEIDTDRRRVYVPHAFAAGSGNVRVKIRCLNAAGVDFYADTVELQKSKMATEYPSLGPTSPICTTSTTVTRASDILSLSNTELGSKFTVLALVQFPYTPIQITGTNPNYIFSVNADTGATALILAGDTLVFSYFGENVLSAGKTWTAYDFMLVGIEIDTTSDKYNYIWDGTLGAEGTVAKGTPTYSTDLFFGSLYDSSAVGHIKFGPTRVYKNLYLTQSEITEQGTKMLAELT